MANKPTNSRNGVEVQETYNSHGGSGAIVSTENNVKRQNRTPSIGSAYNDESGEGNRGNQKTDNEMVSITESDLKDLQTTV